MSRKIDKRNLNTKIELANAFKEICKKKDMNKISITDLIKYCNINRNTFYYHFDDIYGLLTWMFTEEIKKLIQKSDKTDSKTFLNSIFYYVEDNKHILNSAYNAFGREQFKKLLYPYFYAILNKIIDDEISNNIVDENFKHFVINFYSEGIINSIFNYFTGEQKIDKEALIEYILALGELLPKIVLTKGKL